MNGSATLAMVWSSNYGTVAPIAHAVIIARWGVSGWTASPGMMAMFSSSGCPLGKWKGRGQWPSAVKRRTIEPMAYPSARGTGTGSRAATPSLMMTRASARGQVARNGKMTMRMLWPNIPAARYPRDGRRENHGNKQFLALRA
ncbi:MAG: hypothetical protein EXR07_15930 [Acetobacteraceae bacterium]|nr:hypothetical protein [Acetobacteraceae bacterium]